MPIATNKNMNEFTMIPTSTPPEPGLPGWVPESACHYLAHTEDGQSIRTLARSAGVHASTVLRQIRRVETQRDDPLVDAALAALSRSGPGNAPDGPVSGLPDAAAVDRETRRVLRRMCEPGAVLAVADQMEKAVVVRDHGNGDGGARTAVVDRAIALVMALNDWIACDKPGRIMRYRITPGGRHALGQMLADAENHARETRDAGLAEAPAAFVGKPDAQDRSATKGSVAGRGVRSGHCGAAESTLVALARRKDRDGQPFLDVGLVQAGERLREDFELAQIGPHVTQNWGRFLTAGGPTGGHPGGPESGAGDARDRVVRALADLGPGLGDVALHCCCYLEGLEKAEQRMGWSARSGKVVLRIALQRLRQHYDSQSGLERMIG